MTRTHLLSAALIVSALLIPEWVAGQTAPDSVRSDTLIYRIEPINVQARRSIVTVGGAGAIEVDVQRLQLRASPTVEEVLREVPGLHLRTNSRGQAEVSVRGSESRQVAVILDGVPLTLAWDARTDVSVLPASALRGVTFTRGVSTLLAGPNVLGGVVELSLTEPFGSAMPDAQNFSFSLDQEGGYSTSGSVTRPFGGDQGVFRAGLGFRDLPGFSLPDGVSEPVPTAGDRRLNTDMKNVDGFVAARYTRDSGLWGSFSATAHQSERGIAAELDAAEPRFWRYPETRRGIFSVRGGTGDRTTPLGTGRIQLGLALDAGRQEIVSYQSRSYETPDGIEEGDDRTITAMARARHSVGERGLLTTAFTFSDIQHDERVNGAARAFQQRLLSLGAETEWRLVDAFEGPVQRLTLSFGGVFDRATTPQSGGLESLGTVQDWGGRMGVSALMAGGHTIVHAGASRRGRFPSLREAYSEALNSFVPNPDLQPEKLTAVEAGVTTRLGDGELQVVGFRNDLSGAIRRVTFPGGLRQRVNSDELESTGLEFFLTQDVGSFRVGGDLLLQRVELTSPGTEPSTEPENVPEQAGRFYLEFPMRSGVQLRGEAEYTGSQFCQDPGNGEDVELDSGTWLNASASRSWSIGGADVETTVRATNLGDTALYDQCGLPRAGRMFSFQLQLK